MKLFKKFFVIIIFLALYNDLSAQDHVWPMLRYDAQNSGQSPYNGPTEQPKIIKKITFGYGGSIVSRVMVPPAISKDGDIYVSCLNDTLYALDNNLNIKWKKHIITTTTGWGISCPSIGPDGSIYIFDYGDNHLLALDFSTGNIIWETQDLAWYYRGIPIIGNDGKIFLESSVLNVISTSGTIAWFKSLSNLSNAVTLSPDNSVVYAIPQPSIAAFNKNDGTDLWYCNFNGYPACPDYIATDTEGTIYGASTDSLFAISPQGSVIWRSLIDSNANPGWIAIDNTKGRLYVVGSNGNLYAFNKNGQKFWTIGCGHNVVDGAPILGKDGTIYLKCVTASGPYLRAYQPDNGMQLWEISGTLEEGGDGWGPESQPVIGSDGNIYIGHSRGLYVIGTNDVNVEHSSITHNPVTFRLFQNYPNPFNPETTIQYSIPKKSDVTLEIFNLKGQKIKTLVSKTQQAGSYSIVWDSRTEQGTICPSGLYLYKITAGEFIDVKKIMLVK